MHTEAVWYFIPSSQMALISAQVAVWVSNVWSHFARMSFSSINDCSFNGFVREV